MSAVVKSDFEEHSKIESPWSTLRELFSYIFGHRLLFISGAFLTIVTTLAALSEPWLLGYIIDAAIIPKDKERLKLLVAALFVVEFVRVAAFIAENYIFALIGQRVMQDLRVSVSAHLQKLPMSQYDQMPIGRIVTRITNDISSLADMFSAGFVTIIGNLLVVVGIIFSLLTFHFKLGFVSICVFPILVVAAIYFSKRLKLAYRRARARLAALNAFLAENLQGMKTVHAFNREVHQIKTFQEFNHDYADAQFGTVKVFAMFQPSITLATGLSMGLAVWYGGSQVLGEQIQLGVLVSFFAYISTLFQPVREIADKWNFILSGLTSAERVFSILKWPTEDADVSQPPKTLSEIKGHIRFENVSFAYKNQEWILKDFNLEILPGEKVGIVGPTGSGKTTIISLLMRYYEPQKGRITVDGKDIRSFNLRDWRASLGFIQQDVFLFSGSLKDNITLGRPEPKSGEIRDSSFRTLNRQSEVDLHEGGMNISRGERQVVAFCRALYSDPMIWVLDEATANVDSESERGLEKLLENHAQNKTTLIIAHRLSTVRNVDKIVLVTRAGQYLFSRGSTARQGLNTETAPKLH